MTTLGYWNVKGVGQPIRDLLAYLNVEFTNKTYNPDSADDWFNHDKKELRISFPNLPYFIDNDITLTESNAIPIYLIKKYKRPDLLGANEDGSFSEKEIRVAQVMNVVLDIRNSYFDAIFGMSANFELNKEKLYKDKLSVLISRLVEFLGDKEFLFGNLTYADFLFYETIQYIKHSYPEAEVPTKYLQRFENLPRIKEYIKSPNYIQKF